MRRGFTLIELGVGMSILSIVLSISILGIKPYKRYVETIRRNESIFEVEDFLNIAKERAVKRDKVQKIYIDNNNGTFILKLIEEGQLVDKIYLDNIWDDVMCNEKLEINKLGAVKACTIKMITKNEEYKITIQVGGDFISDRKS